MSDCSSPLQSYNRAMKMGFDRPTCTLLERFTTSAPRRALGMAPGPLFSQRYSLPRKTTLSLLRYRRTLFPTLSSMSLRSPIRAPIRPHAEPFLSSRSRTLTTGIAGFQFSCNRSPARQSLRFWATRHTRPVARCTGSEQSVRTGFMARRRTMTRLQSA